MWHAAFAAGSMLGFPCFTPPALSELWPGDLCVSLVKTTCRGGGVPGCGLRLASGAGGGPTVGRVVYHRTCNRLFLGKWIFVKSG